MTDEELEKRLNKLESFMLSAKARLKLEDEINADLLAYIEEPDNDLSISRIASTLRKSLLGRKL